MIKIVKQTFQKTTNLLSILKIKKTFRIYLNLN